MVVRGGEYPEGSAKRARADDGGFHAWCGGREGKGLGFLLFRKAVFGAVAQAFDVGAVFPDGEDGDEEAEDEQGGIPSAVLNATMVPRTPKGEQGEGCGSDNGG